MIFYPADYRFAVRLLAERTTLSMAEIATRCGYGNASSMTRAFRAEFGQPPTALRSN